MKIPYLLLSLLPLAIFAAPLDPLLLGPEPNVKIVVNNRVLTNIHGKPITVFDLMKRMDIVFLRQFPDYTSSTQARFQFYIANWKQTLKDLMDKELILLDAKEAKMEVSQGEIRQEMEELFGPSIILNLDKIGLSFDEAAKIIEQDILIRRMVFLRVTARAQSRVTPQQVKAIYEELSQREKPPSTYHFRLITIRDTENRPASEKAQKLYQDLLEEEKKGPLSEKTFENLINADKEGVTLSQLNRQTEKEISPEIFALLLPLKEGGLSSPKEQVSRSSKNPVFRLAFLVKKEEEAPKSLSDMETEIREDLLEKKIHEEQKSYIVRLKKHFSVNDREIKESFGEDFTPFILR